MLAVVFWNICEMLSLPPRRGFRVLLSVVHVTRETWRGEEEAESAVAARNVGIPF